MMSVKSKWLALAVLLTVFTSGCIYVDGDRDWEFDDRSSWQKRQKQNREKIANLSLGLSVEEIRDEFGNPDFSEGFEADGRRYRVLRYRTHHRDSDGDTSVDETTPLVFENGALVGWGETALRRLL